MKKSFFVLVFSLLLAVPMRAQFAKPLRNKNFTYRNTSAFSLGITGSFAANDMLYSAVHKSILTPYFAPTFGVAMEWNAMKRLSLGLDASYAMRGTNEVFATEFLTSFTTSTFARVKYKMDLSGIEVRIPVTLYLGYGETVKPYLYVAPRFNYLLRGAFHWERTYDDESYAPVVYETDLNNATMMSFDFSAVAGVGLCNRIVMGRFQMLLKFDLSYGFGILNNFSQHEVNEDVAFQGWGDIAHETLGQRRLHDLEARLTLLVPLGKHLNDACSFEQQMKKQK